MLNLYSINSGSEIQWLSRRSLKIMMLDVILVHSYYDDLHKKIIGIRENEYEKY